MIYNNMAKNILISKKNNFLFNINNINNEFNNNYEVPYIQFSEKEGKIKMNLIKNLDFSTLFEPKNIILLKKVIDNLVTSKISNSEYDDITKSLLFKLFQNSLEYLVFKKNRIIQVNTELKNNIKIVLRRTTELENELNKNKEIININSKIIKEEKLKYKEKKKNYEEEKENKKNFRLNKNQNNKNISKINNTTIEKNINIENQTEIQIKNNNENRDAEDIKYFCPICKGKFFFHEENFKSHIHRRHPKKYKKDYNNLYDYNLYLEGINDLEDYLNNLILNNNIIKKQENKFEDLKILMKENDSQFKEFKNNQKKLSEDFSNLIEHFFKYQNESYIKLLNSFKTKKDKEELRKELENNKEITEAITNNSLSKEIIENLKERIEELKKLLEKQYRIRNNKNVYENIDFNQRLGNFKCQNLSIIPEICDNNIQNVDEEGEDKQFNKELINEKEKQPILEINENKNKKIEENKEENKNFQKSKEKSENKELSIIVINREIKTKEEEKEKINNEFFKKFFKENNINIYGNFNNTINNNKDNQLIKERELLVKKEQKFDTNQFIFNFK